MICKRPLSVTKLIIVILKEAPVLKGSAGGVSKVVLTFIIAFESGEYQLPGFFLE